MSSLTVAGPRLPHTITPVLQGVSDATPRLGNRPARRHVPPRAPGEERHPTGGGCPGSRSITNGPGHRTGTPPVPPPDTVTDPDRTNNEIGARGQRHTPHRHHRLDPVSE